MLTLKGSTLRAKSARTRLKNMYPRSFRQGTRAHPTKENLSSLVQAKAKWAFKVLFTKSMKWKKKRTSSSRKKKDVLNQFWEVKETLRLRSKKNQEKMCPSWKRTNLLVQGRVSIIAVRLAQKKRGVKKTQVSKVFYSAWTRRRCVCLESRQISWSKAESQ